MTTNVLGNALRSVPRLDTELVRYCETGELDALEAARNAAQVALTNLDKELKCPRITTKRKK